MNKYTIEIKWALIFVLMMIVWMFAEKIAGLHGSNIDQHALYSNFIAIPAIAIYVLAFLEKRKKDFNGFMSYGQGFITGLKISAIVALLSPVVQLLITFVISPEFFPNIIEFTVSNGKMTLEEAQATLNLQTYIWQGSIGALIMGIVTSLIIAAFTIKKEKPSKV